MTKPDIPLLKVIKVLDSNDLVVAGKRMDEVTEGTDLLVLAIGPRMEELGGTPLVVPKAKLEAKHLAGEYIIASSRLMTEEEKEGFVAWDRWRRVRRRESLDIDPKQATGNPGGRPISVGDFVIRERDLPAFVSFLKQAPEGWDLL